MANEPEAFNQSWIFFIELNAFNDSPRFIAKWLTCQMLNMFSDTMHHCFVLTNAHSNELISHSTSSPHLASLTWKSTNNTFDGLIVATTNRHTAVPHNLCAIKLIHYLQSITLKPAL